MAVGTMPSWEESWWSTCSDLIPVFRSVMTRSRYRMVQEKIGCPMDALLVALPAQGGMDARRATGKRRRARARALTRAREWARALGQEPRRERPGGRSRSRLRRARPLRDVVQRPPRRVLVKTRQEQRRRRRQHVDALALPAAVAPDFTVSLEPPPSALALVAEERPSGGEGHCGIPVHAEHHGEGSSQAVAHLTREPGPVVNMDVQHSNGNASTHLMREAVVSNATSSSTPEKRLCNLSKVTQTPDLLESSLDPLRTRPIIIGPEIYSGYAEVLYAGGSRNPDMDETRGICGFKNSLNVNENRKDVECMHTSVSTNTLFDEMKTADGLRNFENSTPAQIYRTNSIDVKPVHVALAQTHLPSHSDADMSGNEGRCEGWFNIEEVKMDPAAELTTKLEESDFTTINNYMDQEKTVKIAENQNKQIDSVVAEPMLVDSTIHSASIEADYNVTALTRNIDNGICERHNLNPISDDITVEALNVEAVTKTPIIAPCQSIETQTSRAEMGCVDPSSATPPIESHVPTVEAEHVGVEVDVELQSEAETVDVETVLDESATVAWSSAETRGSVESLALEDMDVDVDGVGDGGGDVEGGGGGGGVEVPDEWCDACRQRFSPASDIATLSRRYRVAKWLSSLLELVGLVGGEDPDRVSMEMLGPPAAAPPSRSRGFFF